LPIPHFINAYLPTANTELLPYAESKKNSSSQQPKENQLPLFELLPKRGIFKTNSKWQNSNPKRRRYPTATLFAACQRFLRHPPFGVKHG
jgi:hypothetical protein